MLYKKPISSQPKADPLHQTNFILFEKITVFRQPVNHCNIAQSSDNKCCSVHDYTFRGRIASIARFPNEKWETDLSDISLVELEDFARVETSLLNE
jgi:hypothetical protein